MRIIYTTPRLDNAEQVAGLLEQGGVPVRVLFGPHFRRNTWRGANYRQAKDAGNWPRVMVLNNGDLPKARALLRDAGLMAPAPFSRPPAAADREPAAAPGARARPGRSTAKRVRLLLIAVVALLALVQTLRFLL